MWNKADRIALRRQRQADIQHKLSVRRKRAAADEMHAQLVAEVEIEIRKALSRLASKGFPGSRVVCFYVDRKVVGYQRRKAGWFVCQTSSIGQSGGHLAGEVITEDWYLLSNGRLTTEGNSYYKPSDIRSNELLSKLRHHVKQLAAD